MSQDVKPSPIAARSELWRRLLAEGVGAGLLVTVVVGSGIAAQRLSPGNVGLQLLENSTATVFGLAVLILVFGPVSGAHFNPVVSAADWFVGRRAHGVRPFGMSPPTRWRRSPERSSAPSWRTPCTGSPP